LSFINREWTPENADEMHKEDWIAIFFSVVSYIALMVGTAMSVLLIPIGFVILTIGIIAALIMYWIIDPKLRSISVEYEKKEKDYLLQLEEIQKWEKDK
jgi:dipeptide/tripeptide permease